MLAAALVVIGLVVAATAIGLLQRGAAGRTRTARGEVVDPTTLGVEGALGTRVTFLQFSTAVCAACRPTARLLGELRSEIPGARHIEVRVDERLDLADRFGVRSAPTTLLLDRRGAVRGRVVGVPRRDELQRAVSELLEEHRARTV